MNRFQLWCKQWFILDDTDNYHCQGCRFFDNACMPLYEGYCMADDYELIEDMIAERELCPRVTPQPIYEEY